MVVLAGVIALRPAARLSYVCTIRPMIANAWSSVALAAVLAAALLFAASCGGNPPPPSNDSTSVKVLHGPADADASAPAPPNSATH